MMAVRAVRSGPDRNDGFVGRDQDVPPKVKPASRSLFATDFDDHSGLARERSMSTRPSRAPPALALGGIHRPRSASTFDSFVVGALQYVATTRPPNRWRRPMPAISVMVNPLYIHAGVGSARRK